LRFAPGNDDLSLTPTDCFTDAGVNWTPCFVPLAIGWMLATYVGHPDDSASVQIRLLDAKGAVVANPTPSISGVPEALIGRPFTQSPPFVVFANGNQGSSFLRQLVVVKDRLLAAFVTYDERFHLDQTLYLAWIRP
jgi:hypothetical protein